MIFLGKYQNQTFRGMAGFVIGVIIFLLMAITGNAQTNPAGSSGVEQIRRLSILLKLSLEEYERLRKEVPSNIPKIILVLENIVNLLKEIRTTHENQRDSEERTEKIRRLIELYEGKLSYYKELSSP